MAAAPKFGATPATAEAGQLHGAVRPPELALPPRRLRPRLRPAPKDRRDSRTLRFDSRMSCSGGPRHARTRRKGRCGGTPAGAAQAGGGTMRSGGCCSVERGEEKMEMS